MIYGAVKMYFEVKKVSTYESNRLLSSLSNETPDKLRIPYPHGINTFDMITLLHYFIRCDTCSTINFIYTKALVCHAICFSIVTLTTAHYVAT